MKLPSILRISFLSLSVICSAWAASASAQQQMTLEELEAYVQQQRIELEQAKARRDENAAQAEELRLALEEQQSRQEFLRTEVEALCSAHDDVKPGTFDECMSQYGS